MLVLVVGVSLALGFRSSASPLAWLAAAGILALQQPPGRRPQVRVGAPGGRVAG
ncbi:MAG TPA: hypothetical protein VIZ20_13585 [Streptosporangiaceae bacterium]